MSRIREIELERGNEFPELNHPCYTPAIWICYSRRKALRYVTPANEWERTEDPDQPLTLEEEGLLESVTEIPTLEMDRIVHDNGDEGYLLLRL